MKHLIYLMYGTGFLLVAIGVIFIMAWTAKTFGIVAFGIPLFVFLAYCLGRMIHDALRA